MVFLRSELELSPARWRAMGRIIVACAIAVTLIMTLRIPEGGWIILTIFIVSMPNTGASFRRAVQRQLGIGVGCFVAITLVIFLHQQPWILVPMVGLVMGAGVYLSRTSVAPSVPVLGALTMILAIGGIDVAAPEGIHQALWRFVDISAGNIIGSLCQALVWPEKPEKLLIENMASSLRTSAKKIGQSLLPATEVMTDETELQLGEERVMNALAQWIVWLDNAENCGSQMRDHHHDMVNLIGDVNQIAIAAQQSARASAYLAKNLSPPEFPAEVRDRIRELQDRCERYASAVAAQDWNQSVDRLPALVHGLAQTLARADNATAKSSPDDTEAKSTFEASLLSSATSIAEALDSMPDAAGFVRPATSAVRKQPGQAAGPAPDPPSRNPLFQRERATLTPKAHSKINRTDVEASAKAALAAIVAYIYLNTIEWPGGITAVVTAILVSLDNYGAMIQKSVLRVAGAVIGGIASVLVIVFIIPNITSLPPFLVATGVVFGIAAWTQTGSSRISYAGLQIGLIAGLTLVSTYNPSVDLMLFRDRLLGIFTGLVSVLLVYGIFGEIRARVWALDNNAETLRIMALGASIGLRDIEPTREQTPAYGFRHEIYRRISFGYRLLTEASYEDWLVQDREKNRADGAALHAVLDTTRAIQRVTMSLVWNRLEFQKLETPEFESRAALEAIGRTLPGIFVNLAAEIENPERHESREENPTAELSQAILRAEAQMDQGQPSTSDPQWDGHVHRLLRAQLGFYQQMEILLARLDDQSRNLSISGDQFSLAARLHGSEHRLDAPSIRPV